MCSAWHVDRLPGACFRVIAQGSRRVAAQCRALADNWQLPQHVPAISCHEGDATEPAHQRKKLCLLCSYLPGWRFALHRQQSAIPHHAEQVRAAFPTEPDESPAHSCHSRILALAPCDGGVMLEHLENFSECGGLVPVVAARGRRRARHVGPEQRCLLGAAWRGGS